MALKLRRGTDAERQLITPEAGEPLWIDNEALWIGDGSTVGGIKVTGGIENDLATVSIDALSDVDTTSSAPTNGQTLIWNTDKFEPGNPALTINDLTNVDVVSNPPSNGDSLVWNGASWVPGSPTFSGSGNITGNLTGDVYAQDGTTKVLENGTDGTDSTYKGRVNGTLIGNVIGDVDGDLKGSVFAEDSSVMIDAINDRINADRADFYSLTVDSIGTFQSVVTTNTDSVRVNLESDGQDEPLLKLISETNTGTFGNPIISINNHHAGTYSQEITFSRSAGTADSPTAATSGDYVGSLTFRVHDGSDYTSLAAMHVVADTVTGTDDVASKIDFYTRDGAIASEYEIALTLRHKGAEFTGYVQFGSYTTTERNALTAANGMVIYNTTDNKFQGYENGAWANLI